MTKVNLGCGTDYREDWLNVDIDGSVNPDIQHDLNEYPWPIADGTATHVEARHVLEHLDDPAKALDEIARTLQPKGTLLWVYPIGHTRFEDTTHQWYWNYNSGAFQAGDRGDHTHEVADRWTLIDQSCDWRISQGEPLVYLYTKYREWAAGPGPWLEQIPGVSGEMQIRYRYDP